MKFTGLILALVGLLAGVICVVVLVNPTAPGRDGPAISDTGVERPNMVVPLAVCGACVAVGAAMYMYGGGKSYYVSNDPRVRN
ncbi:MAG TPA: hypothetical protein VHR66_27870 [Gemmataceae bacterium]|jgi:hypothetical protein|nr:hypothetical protein [Gemmataceae bacterium]